MEIGRETKQNMKKTNEDSKVIKGKNKSITGEKREEEIKEKVARWD